MAPDLRNIGLSDLDLVLVLLAGDHRGLPATTNEEQATHSRNYCNNTSNCKQLRLGAPLRRGANACLPVVDNPSMLYMQGKPCTTHLCSWRSLLVKTYKAGRVTQSELKRQCTI